MLVPVLTAVLAAAGASAQFGFRVVNQPLTECGATQIEWQGGVPPLYITAIVRSLRRGVGLT